ncbi:MAG: response regulator transcription factor [Chloroflexi bacterium]|nr:response regulator transcription factor [Chloroflexota bacterium]
MIRQFRILAVDDEKRILTFLKSKLKASGYDVLTASNGKEALELAHTQEPDLIALDIVMPKMDGIETLKELRSFSSVPVIMLSAKGSDTDKIKGLSLGADDYLAKPFNPDELVARIEAIRRRSGGKKKITTPEHIVVGNVTIYLDKCKVSVDNKETSLTRIEWLLLSKLAQNAGRLMTYEELLTTIWGPEYLNDVQILRTWISRLRKKIEKDSDTPRIISTIPKVGYMMDIPQV